MTYLGQPKNNKKNTFQANTFKVEEISRTIQGLAQKLKDSSWKNGIQGLFKTVQTLSWATAVKLAAT